MARLLGFEPNRCDHLSPLLGLGAKARGQRVEAPPCGKRPALSSCFATCGSWRTRFTSALIFCTMSRGVPAGAKSTQEDVPLKPG